MFRPPICMASPLGSRPRDIPIDRIVSAVGMCARSRVALVDGLVGWMTFIGSWLLAVGASCSVGPTYLVRFRVYV